MDANDAASLANRSAAYLNTSHYVKALHDAQRCQQLEPANSMGYLRQAAVFLAQKKYQEAMVPLKDGLAAVVGARSREVSTGDDDDHHHHQEALEHALVGAQRALALQTFPTAAQSALYTMAAHQAAQWRVAQAEQALTDVLKDLHEKKANALQASAVANKARLLEELQNLPQGQGDEDRNLWDVVFLFVLDTTGRGVVPSQNVMQLFGRDLDKKEALHNILLAQQQQQQQQQQKQQQKQPAGNSSGSNEEHLDLTADTFATVMQQFATDAQSTPLTLVTMMVQESTTTTNAPPQQPDLSPHEAKERRMRSFFSILEQYDGEENTVSFLELACGIYAYAHAHFGGDPSLLSHTKLLLMMDPNDTRRLNYAQFGKLLLSLASTWNEPLDDVVDDLLVAFTSTEEGTKISDELLQDIIATSGDAGEESSLPASVDALTYARTKKLFDLFDVDGDGSIDFAELLKGLRRYQQASSQTASQTLDGSFKGAANMNAEKIAVMIMGHDEDHNQTVSYSRQRCAIFISCDLWVCLLLIVLTVLVFLLAQTVGSRRICRGHGRLFQSSGNGFAPID